MSDAPSVAAELVRRIMAGEGRAEDELVERYGGPLAYVLRRISRDEATAEDLYQETLHRALTKIRRGEVREPEQLSAYLSSLARNIATQHYRRLSRRGEEEPLEEDGPAEETTSYPNPLAGLLRRESTQMTRQVLDELGAERDRQVLQRFYLEEDEGPSIARDLGLPIDHFYRVLHRARQRFRRLFEARLGPVSDSHSSVRMS